MRSRRLRRVIAHLSLIVIGVGLSGQQQSCTYAARRMMRDSGVSKSGDAGAKKPEPGERTAAVRQAARERREGLGGVKRLHVVGLTGPVDAAAAAAVLKAAGTLKKDDALLLEIDAAGGALTEVLRLRDQLAKKQLVIVALVKGQAVGEAALLPLLGQVVVMNPRARWGALSATQFGATRYDDKKTKELAEAFAAASKQQLRPVAWARAMVTPPAGPAKKGAPKPGERVTLSAKEAYRLGLSETTARDVAQLRRHLGLSAAIWKDGQEVKAASKPRPTPKEIKKRDVDPRKVVAGTRRIVVLKIRGTIELGLRSFALRVLRKAKRGETVILDIDTFGGRVDAATEIRDALLRSKAKTVAFINPRAISAGALISLACDLIVMAPGGSIGAATPITTSGGKANPVGEKYVSYMRKEMKSTAEAKGRRGDLAEAMVDMSIEVDNVPEELKESISGLKKGKLLTLTTKEALALDMAEMTARHFDDLVAKLGLQNVPVVKPSANWAERIARFLTGPIVSSLLMTIGILGLLLEFYTPGFGIAGGIGLFCLFLFFFGHQVVSLPGWEPVLLFLLGVALLAVEVFVTPGFGLLGSVGLLAVLGSLVWTLSRPGVIPVGASWEMGYIKLALVQVFASIIAVAVLMALSVKFLPKAGPFKRLVLSQSISADATSGADKLPEGMADRQELVGQEGLAETALRPSGRVKVAGARLDVVSEGDFIDKGARVKVVQVEGRRIVVKELVS